MEKTLYALLVAALSGLLLFACDSQAPPEPVAELRPDELERPPAAIVPLPEVEPEKPRDPAALAAAEQIAEAMLDPDPFIRARRLATLLPSLGPEGALGAERALRDKKFQSTRGGTEIELLARFWATHEPEAASTWALTRAVAGYRLSAIFAALSQWAESDPPAALAAAERWEDRTDVTDIVQIALVHGWFEADPEGLGRYLLGLGMGHARQRKMANYARLLVERQGPDAAERWAAALPDDDEALKRNAHSQVAAALTAYDLAAALRFYEAHSAGPYGRDLHYVIAVNWARREDGDAAVEWLSTLPEGTERNGAIRNAFSTWAMLHPDAASRWMVARFAGEAGEREPWLQLVVPGFALIVMRERSPAEAITWAQRIEDEEQRKKLLIRITRAWRWQDEAAAEAWLAESPLSEEERERARQAPRLDDRPRA